MSKPLELCYGLAGTDSAAVQALRERLQQRVTSEGGTVEMIRGRAADELAAQLSQAQFLPGTRLLVVVDADRYRTDDAKKIAGELALAAPDTVLCLIAAGGKLAAPLAAAAQASGGLVVRDVAADPAAFVTAAAKRARVMLTADAIAALAAVEDLDSEHLSRELEKLAVWADGESADAAAVAAVCVFHAPKDTQPWGMLQAVNDRDGKRSVSELGLLWRSGEQPARLAGLVKGRLRRLSTVRALVEKGANQETVAKLTDSKPYAAGKLIAAAKKWTLTELALASARMEQTERDIWAAGNGPAGRLELERALPAITARRRSR